MSDDNFLSRWSRRKHEANREPTPAPIEPAVPPAAAAEGAAVGEGGKEVPAELPPLESLTPDSDFSPFMRDQVSPEMRRAALKTLFRDPRFNVMDGLDVYIDDYSKPDPLPEGWLEKMNQFAAMDAHKLLDPRVEAKPEDAAPASEETGKLPEEQRVAQAPEDVASDTPDAGSKPSQLRES